MQVLEISATSVPQGRSLSRSVTPVENDVPRVLRFFLDATISPSTGGVCESGIKGLRPESCLLHVQGLHQRGRQRDPCRLATISGTGSRISCRDVTVMSG